ncbi:MAG: hypothetical protein HZC23_03365 [Rhodocyclales bacterium]|nr:hypothetical protein [Rhodocyclales bacterium]
MASNKKGSTGSGSRVLTLIWLLLSAGLAYPVYSLMVSWGFNQALSGIIVFIGICLLYDIPYRARVKEQHEAIMQRSDQWRSRTC